MAEQPKVSTTVPLRWDEVYFTNCPMVSANNVDQELGWCREEFKKIGVEYAYFRSRPENNWYPHYIHNLDNLIRFGGLYPADPCARRHPPHGTARRDVGLRRRRMMVRARDDVFRMDDLKGKKIGLSKSLNTIKNDWWRIQEHMGIEHMLRVNDMTMDDVEIVEFPYPDDWYDKPEMLQVNDEQPVRALAPTRPQARPGVPPAWRRHSKAARSTPSTPRARSSSTCRRPPGSSR